MCIMAEGRLVVREQDLQRTHTPIRGSRASRSSVCVVFPGGVVTVRTDMFRCSISRQYLVNDTLSEPQCRQIDGQVHEFVVSSDGQFLFFIHTTDETLSLHSLNLNSLSMNWSKRLLNFSDGRTLSPGYSGLYIAPRDKYLCAMVHPRPLVDGTYVFIVELASGKVTVLLEGVSGCPRGFSFSNAEDRLACVRDNAIHVWHMANLHNGSCVICAPAVDFNIPALKFSPDDKLLVAGGIHGDVSVWDSESGSLLRLFSVADIGYVCHIMFLGSFRVLLCGHDRRIAPKNRTRFSLLEDILKTTRARVASFDEMPFLSHVQESKLASANCVMMPGIEGKQLKLYHIFFGKWTEQNTKHFSLEFRRKLFHLLCIRSKTQLSRLQLPRLPHEVWALIFEYMQPELPVYPITEEPCESSV
jgi:WD40 repeat protein